jgi:hypothetical protein
MMDVSAAIADAEQVLRTVCPDLDGVPVYLLTTSDAPHVFGRCEPGLRGSTTSLFDLAMQPFLTKLGRYCGRGFCCYLHLPGIETAEVFVATVLHEAAHWLSSDTSPDNASPHLAQFVPTMMALTSPSDAVYSELPLWHNHELDFVRAAAHVRFRTLHHGFGWCAADVSFGGSTYGLSDRHEYMSVMRDECYQRASDSIRSILETEPPQSLVSLWERDTHAKADA